MKRRPPKWLLVVPFFLPLFGCHSRVDINNAFQRIERTWQLDYQRTEDEYRWRVVESDPATTYRAVRQTFLDIGLPIQNESISGQTLIAQHQAPLPLTIEEWKQVAKEENPRLREIAPWFIYLPDNPEKYIVNG